MLLILTQLGLATTSSIAGGHAVALGAVTTAYAGSSLLGYFEVGQSPVLSFIRANINAPCLGIAFIISLAVTGFNTSILALACLLFYDGFQGLSGRTYQTPGDIQVMTPITNFFLESWRNNGFQQK